MAEMHSSRTSFLYRKTEIFRVVKIQAQPAGQLKRHLTICTLNTQRTRGAGADPRDYWPPWAEK